MSDSFEIFSNSREETEAAGERLARLLLPQGKAFVALFGEMGAGKTAFTRGFARVIVPDAHVTSPSFAIINSYSGTHKLYHFDFYRISSPDELDSFDFDSYLDEKAFIITEWSERIADYLPPSRTEVRFEVPGEGKRVIGIVSSEK